MIPAELVIPDVDTTALEEWQLRREVTKLLINLAPREERIVRAHYGFNVEPQTRRVIGDAMGVTDPRVAQIEARAMRRLKHPELSRNVRRTVTPHFF